jgi:hypothetical protein
MPIDPNHCHYCGEPLALNAWNEIEHDCEGDGEGDTFDDRLSLGFMILGLDGDNIDDTE